MCEQRVPACVFCVIGVCLGVSVCVCVCVRVCACACGGGVDDIMYVSS